MKRVVTALSFVLSALASCVGFAGSAFDGASLWFRAGYNPLELVNGLNWNLYEFYDALYLGDPEPLDDGHSRVTATGGRRSEAAPDYNAYVGNIIRQETVDVPMPFARRTLKNRQVIHLIQPSRVTDNTTYYHYSALRMGKSTLKGLKEFANDGSYTVLLRYKFDGYIDESQNAETTFLGIGFGYSNNVGCQLQIKGDSDNYYFSLRRGKTSTADIKGMMDSPHTRLSKGKWIDLAFVVDQARVTLYTCAEGGGFYTWSGTVAMPSGTSLDSVIAIPNLSGGANGGTSKFSDAASAFRGSIQQLGVWYRALSGDEVCNAFCDGCPAGELVRFGVENDSSWEFAGWDKIKNKATTATSADLATDWRHLPPALNADCRTSTVTFTATGADLTWQPKELRLKTTTDSASGTVTVTLNGTALVTDAAAGAGSALVADVPLSALKVGENTLVFTRTDSGDGDVACDCFTIGAKSGAGAEIRRHVEGDVFADAFGWYRHARDFNNNGILCSNVVVNANGGNTYEFPEALHDRPELREHPANLWTVEGPTTNAQHRAADVTVPGTGVTLKDEPTIYLVQPSWPTNSEETLWIGHCGGIRHDIFGITNSASYSAFVRVKLDPNMTDPTPGKERMFQIFGLGYQWGNMIGSALYLKGTDPENLYINFWRGKGGVNLTATQGGDPADRLCVGKWIDFAIVCSNGYKRVYTHVEGGSLVEQSAGEYSAGYEGGTPSASSRFIIGTVSGMAHYSPWVSAPLAGAEKEALDAMRGWIHQAAVWPRFLTVDELRQALYWPRPDLVRLGVENGSAAEFLGEGSAFTVRANGDFDPAQGFIDPASNYSVTFDVPASEAARNQMIRLSTPPTTDLSAGYEFEFALNGTTVTNWSRQGGASWRFAPDATGVVEVGVPMEDLVEGENTLKVTRVDANGVPFPIDALSFGNGGKLLRVRKGKRMIVVIR